MILIDVIGFNEIGLIEAVFDERLPGDTAPDLRTRLVLDDHAHLYRQLIADWEDDGNTIPAYEPPATTRLPNLYPDQFWFGLRAAGYEDDVREWVASLKDTDPMTWAWASAKLEYATFFERDHPLVEAFRNAAGISEQELDALWSFAAQ